MISIDFLVNAAQMAFATILWAHNGSTKRTVSISQACPYCDAWGCIQCRWVGYSGAAFRNVTKLEQLNRNYWRSLPRARIS